MKRSDAPPPGWYPDPEGGARLRYWEGDDWSDRFRHRPPITPDQTTTLALGLTRAALDFLAAEAQRRSDLQTPLEALESDYQDRVEALLAAVTGQPHCSNDDLRRDANSLVLRATQAALAAAKGAGFVAGHPAGRWCREALFFLVWSCPQPVLAANLCELAGILGD